jgi:hypothetical protein
MKRCLVIVAVVAVLSGCGLTPEEVRDFAAGVREDVDTVKTMVDNVAKINDVRADIAAANAQVESALADSTAAFGLIAEFMAKENPTKEDADAAVEIIRDGLNRNIEALEIVRSIDDKFGKTELPPDIEKRIKAISARVDKTIEVMVATAEKVEKWSNAIKSGLGFVAKVAGGTATGGTGGIVGTLIGLATLAGAAASGAKKGGTT